MRKRLTIGLMVFSGMFAVAACTGGAGDWVKSDVPPVVQDIRDLPEVLPHNESLRERNAFARWAVEVLAQWDVRLEDSAGTVGFIDGLTGAAIEAVFEYPVIATALGGGGPLLAGVAMGWLGLRRPKDKDPEAVRIEKEASFNEAQEREAARGRELAGLVSEVMKSGGQADWGLAAGKAAEILADQSTE